MLLAQEVAFAEARSYLAALADTAQTFEASAAYEQILLDLDALHSGDVPPLAEVRTDDTAVLHAVAGAATEELAEQGIDALLVELFLARLVDARSLDRR